MYALIFLTGKRKKFKVRSDFTAPVALWDPREHGSVEEMIGSVITHRNCWEKKEKVTMVKLCAGLILTLPFSEKRGGQERVCAVDNLEKSHLGNF